MRISATKKGLRQETVHCQVGFNSEIDVPALSHVQVRESRYWRRMWTACLNVIDFFWAATRNCLLYMFRGATTLWHCHCSVVRLEGDVEKELLGELGG